MATEHDPVAVPSVRTTAVTPTTTPAPTSTSARRGSSVPMWILGLVIMIDQVDQNVVKGVIPQLEHSFGIGDFEIGLLLTAFVFVNGIITVPAGYLADRWNRTRTIGHTVVGWSLITALTAAAQNFGQLLGLRALLGFGQAVTEPSANSLLSDYYPTNERGRVFAWQQVLFFVGAGVGLAVGGFVGPRFGWHWAFIVVGPPGIVIALLAYTLREPRRGYGDRLHLGIEDSPDEIDEPEHLFEHGLVRFTTDMARGLRDDLRVIIAIPTLRLALVGVSALTFTVIGVSTWMAEFYRRFSGLTQTDANNAVALLIVLGAIPGVLCGGRLADRYATRVRGARVVIPAWCIGIGTTFITASFLPMPFAASFALALVGIFVVTMAVPALRAGLADAVPANLRGAGFGAFNLMSIVFGAAAAPFIVGALAQLWNLRIAFLVVMPPVFVGAYVLWRARDHLENDAAKIFDAIVHAMAEQEARDTQD